MADDEDLSLDDFDAEDIEVEAMEAYHLGGTRFSASFELSEEEAEVSRSVLLDVDFGDTVQFQTLLEVEDSIMSHTSLSRDRHFALELGGIVHALDGESRGRSELEEGFLRRIRGVSETEAIVVGEDGIAYRYDGATWTEIEPFEGGDFVDAHIAPGRSVHACGPIGTLARLDGNAWTDLDVPIQEDLNAVLVTPSDGLFVAGSNGMCFQLRDSELIEFDAGDDDFFGVRDFKGRRYWSSANYGLYVQDGRRLVPFRDLGQSFTLHTSTDLLVIAGWKEIFTFDGETFRGFRLGWDGSVFLEALDMDNWPEE